MGGETSHNFTQQDKLVVHISKRLIYIEKIVS